jgi:hypothetical protein
METKIMLSEAEKIQVEKENKLPDFSLPENVNEIEDQLKSFRQEPIIDNIDTESELPIKGKRGRKKRGEIDSEFAGKIAGSSVVSGALFLLLIDFVIPNIICLLNNKVSKKKINPALLKLSEDQRKELEPLADEVAKQINLKGNPMTIFIASLAAIYLGNFMLLKSS